MSDPNPSQGLAPSPVLGLAPALALPVAPDLGFGQTEAWALAIAALALSGFFAVLRTALERASRARLLQRVESEARRKELLPLLRRTEQLATSASAFKLTADVLFVVMVLSIAVQREEGWRTPTLVTALAIAVPALLLCTEILPSTVARSHGDRLLLAVLPAFWILQLPFAALAWPLERLRRLVRRGLGMKETSEATRELVEDLRDVIEESERADDLDESEREIIENVMEFREVDAAEIMTPRTEIVAVEIGAGSEELVAAVATSRHSRIPVYEGSLDTIVGSISAREVLQAIATDGLSELDARSILRPAKFVPETKLVSELLAEFRGDKQKLAIVLDEYGGTAGLVTLGDVLSEIVGDIPDEDDAEGEAITRLSDDLSEVDATTRISEVNEELELDLPEEEDFETLAGFVLAVLGHFPKAGESFEQRGCEFRVVDASDRRVLRVQVRRLVSETR